METKLDKIGRALLVQEPTALRASFSEYLQARGIDTYTAQGVPDARALLSALKPDVTAVDLDLDEGDGLDLVEDIAKVGSSCVVVSARDQVRDRVRALSMGVDDYLAKPVDLEELFLRIRNILNHRRAPNIEGTNPILDLNGVKVDMVTRALLRRDGVAGSVLTESELSLLRMLTENRDKIVSKDMMFKMLHGRSLAPATRSLDVGVSRLRIKLRAGDSGLEIRSVRQAGYMLTQDERRSARAD